MNNHNLIYTTLALLVAFCFHTSGSFSQQSAWKLNQDGWVLRKAPGSTKYKKFFAIGLWNMPGYTINSMEEDPVTYRKKAKLYLDKTPLYNMVYMTPGNKKDLHKRVEITGSIKFPETLKKYLDKIQGINQGVDSDYARRQYIKSHINDKEFENALDSTISHLITLNGPVDHIWAPIDEIVNGGAGSGWCWHSVVGKKINERIKNHEKNTLVYTDLAGGARGNCYLFEQSYLQNHGSMPAAPPYEALGKDAKIIKERPLLGFSQAYDGKPVYDNGTVNYTEYDLETLKKLFFENIRLCAKEYQGCGDVFGMNTFIDVNTYPVLSGITVDAIKAGIGPNIPVWLFFDGNGYAKPSDISAEEFVQILKCQIYTSIIHGATGILFWNDRSISPEVFNALEPVIKELTDNLNIVYLKTVENKFENDLHYVIKKKDKNHKFIIASNTSKTETIELNIPNINKKYLKPLEVFISPL
ncbi:hypothetical protein [uncultured Bacteroides sp.]|uniref:hypothetical protein n=1 Tax=uncultured Bacteroides sp. TaxID=162156 RepID=UPI002AABBC62|nr:hypothetical protein [uncultured Bacteroides sp.]